MSPEEPTFLTCSSDTETCFTGNGESNVFEPCTRSNECATSCCDKFWLKCIARADNCAVNYTFPEVALGAIIALAIGVALVTGALILAACLR